MTEALRKELRKHAPTIKTDPHEAWLVCTCGWQIGEGNSWQQRWTSHIEQALDAVEREQ